MCGIAGVLLRTADRPAETDARRLAAALQHMRHRGPDDEGVCATQALLLGHRRLSILDLSPAGHQPMETRDGRFVCSLNGEIYNYLELRQELGARRQQFRTGTDTEVLLAAFAEWGPECVKRFRGQFAFAIWDRTAGSLWLARDRVGEKPLYYCRDGERFVFASEIKAILELIPAPPRLSPDSINAYLHYQFVLEPDTPLDGIRKLPAGHVLHVAPDRWSDEPHPYWELAALPPAQGDPVERLRHALDSAIELTLRSDAPAGLALSGGLDSGVIAALASRRRADLTAFTVGYPGQHDFDERAQARELAASLGIPWHSAELRTADFVEFFPAFVALMDEPVADVAAYGHFAVSRLASEHGVKVLLTGIGGDELFFGYGWVRDALRLSRLKREMVAAAPAGMRRAAILRAILERTPIFNIIANRRLPAGWRTAVDRAFDAGRLDLDHPAEWVFYQLDYHWKPAAVFSEAVFAPGFKQQLTPRGAYRLMDGMDRDHPSLEVSVANLLFRSWLVSNCLDLGDRMSMASSVETRVPLLDSALIETVVGFWKSGRSDDALGHKTWLRAIARELLPPQVTDRPKRGFVTPTVEWTQAVNARYQAQLEDGALVAAGVLDPDRLRAWLRHTPDGIHRYFFQYKLTLLEFWCRAVAPNRQGPAA
ncbi:MAG TPA: asparagine synthase (glutamine-hydrolyzing) [Vicinamibacterales bacterium]|nr:asparagine synthase (glutamine-hydrolyzing) [Vicinamibacterales bacterium]